MGFLSGGGGGGQTSTQTIQPNLRTDNAVQGPLGSAAVRQINAQGAFSSFNPTQLLPGTPMGQIAMQGPNPTIFGQPYNTAVQAPYFGSAQTTPPSPSPFAQGQGGGAMGAGSSQGGGASGSGNPLGQTPGAGNQPLPWDMNPQQMQQMMQMMMGWQQQQQASQQPSPVPGYNPALTNYQPNYQASNGSTTPGAGNTPHPPQPPASGSGGSSGVSK